ncbi:phosphonate metabolism transcriptional regulator PhnF [Pseudodesulfovibrio cashew]|uniref:Phosphonate metabolism transcriptional regulator PhnF n=1 Tax=Pseudodesulfovibrio cashew TaxID=2678688 RepID=A0A6I6JAW0_9BACT|nr:phosphonate metabolism transcriptional regulator PhnF [Pseudodesulfovibrio cashew]QGY39201.1 phosphonate metabolism transcriptional regulator PhnF [Pseudodesulfovibrio cashew]
MSPDTERVALWRRIYGKIKDDVGSGALAPGDKLPSENRLAAHWGVNRHTVRRALAALEEEGVLRVEQGRGSFVREPVISYPVKRRTRFSENLLEQRRVPGNLLLRAGQAEADAEVAEALGIAQGSEVIRLVTAGEADGRRISLSISFFPARRFPGFIAAYRQEESVTRTLARFGVADYARMSSKVIARMPSRDEARELQQPRTRPVLVTESVNVDTDGVPVEFGICLFASDWVQLVVEPSH